MKTKPTRRFRFISVPLAAALVLVLTVGIAFAGVYSNRIHELIMPGDATDMISLQGFVDSPEYMAAAEWFEFEEGYDKDGSILESVGNEPTPWDKKYDGYFVYSQEMADKVDEIADKYDLKLHTGSRTVAEMKPLYKKFGNFATCEDGGGYFYKDGSFEFDGSETVNGCYVDYQFRRTMKGVFDTVYLNIGDVNEYEQWEYTTSCGETVLLALGNDKALIICDYEDCFVAVNVLSGTETAYIDDNDTITKKNLEALADSFDFTVLGKSKASNDNMSEETTEAVEEQADEVSNAGSEFGFACNPVDDPDATITRGYGNSFGKMHTGIDIAAPESTAINAVADGKAVVPEPNEAYGNYVVIEHDNGWSTLYAHCESISVKDGEKVKAGQEIATVGLSGNSSGPHLHLELLDDSGESIDPEPYINK